ncbi:hypothetical protein [Rhodanobacter sp. A1T4]|uniref:hypothetical protein n=1 Tax=Rhodanobacter sp. A1T4 TaxID=2723087 RepID=UPI0016085474|nr:hypothetical protein [Rhodanobacter sp. A1T4]MBB6249007.1 hypothetical protein [Rhodanobacter sp. A1T4]
MPSTNRSPSEFAFEINDAEYTAILSDADPDGVLVSLRLPSGKIVTITEPYEVFYSTAEAVNAARLFAADLGREA